jgi:endoglucanase
VWLRAVLPGGAPAAAAIARSGTGVLAGAVSIPSRYVHSSVGTVHLDDLEGAVALLEAFVADAGWLAPS